MKRLAAVLAALAVAGCGGSTTDPVAAYRYQINICASDGPCTQIDRCYNHLTSDPGAPPVFESRYCRQVAGYPAPVWTRRSTDPQLCSPADCQELDVNPPAPTCQAVIECSRPL